MPTRRERLQIFRRDSFTCHYCGGVFEPGDLECDHLHPASWDGPDADTNYVTACYGCNQAKRDRPAVAITSEQAINALVRSLDPSDRAGGRQYARIAAGDVPIAKGSIDDVVYAESRRAEIVEHGRELNTRRFLRQVDELNRRERLRISEKFFEDLEMARLIATLETIRPK